jgi:citrate lyase beta subunit
VTALRLVLGILSPFSARSPQSESLGEEKWTAGAVSVRTMGASLPAGFEELAMLEACESGVEVVATPAVRESVEVSFRGSSRRQPAVNARIIRLRFLIEHPSMIESA